MSTALRVIPDRGVVGLSVRRLALWAGLAVGVAVLLSCLLTLWLMPRQPGVVRFDMKQTMASFYLSAAKQSLTPARSEALSARFTEALQASLRDYQRRHHVIILVAPAVVEGAPDVTPALQRDIARRMQASREQGDAQ